MVLNSEVFWNIDKVHDIYQVRHGACVWYNLRTMFGKMKQFAMKKVLQSQMKGVPEEQQQMIMELIEKDPKLFEQMAKEMQAEMKANGNNQMAAAGKVMPKYQAQIMAIMSPETKEKLAQMQMNAQSQGQFNPDGSIRS
jgi:hypothetical protein